MQVSTSAPNSASEEVAEMNRKLQRSEEDLDLMRKQIEVSQGKRQEVLRVSISLREMFLKDLILTPSCFCMTAATAELETLKAELAKARQEAEQQKAAASKAGEELAAEKAAREKDQARVLEVEETLEGVYKERDAFQEKEKVASTELEKLRQAHAEVQSQARADA